MEDLVFNELPTVQFCSYYVFCFDLYFLKSFALFQYVNIIY